MSECRKWYEGDPLLEEYHDRNRPVSYCCSAVIEKISRDSFSRSAA